MPKPSLSLVFTTTPLQVELDIHLNVMHLLSKGHRVVMHSRKSWGRVPTIVSTMLLRSHPAMVPDQAIAQVRKILSRHSVQTVKQYNHIHEFDEHMKRRAKSATGAEETQEGVGETSSDKVRRTTP